MRNVQQILGIITATFGTEVLDVQADSPACEDPPTEAEALTCEWRRIVDAAKSGQNTGRLEGDWTSATIKARPLVAVTRVVGMADRQGLTAI